MKKNNSLIIILLVCTLFIHPNAVFAQNLKSPGYQNEDINITFEDLGYLDFTLYSPFDSNNVRFTIPPNWKFAPGGNVVINYDVLLSGPDVLDATGNGREFGGTVSVLFNRQVVETIYIDTSGTFSLPIAIPDSALVSLRADGSHLLEFELLASDSCEYNIRTAVTIKSESYFAFPVETSPPTLDLARMPFPFYPVSTFAPNETIFVIPTSPELDELKATMNLLSGFGTMTSSDFLYRIVTVEELTDELASSANLIFVGKPDKFDLLSEVQFPQPVSSGQFSNLNEANAADGIVQLANSPWNAEKAVLLVSGDTGEAVNKAAQAISTGEIFAATDPTLVFISTVQPFTDPQLAVESFSFRDLGFQSETVRGFGVHNLNLNFYLPREQVGSTTASLDLKYLSNLFTDGRDMSISVILNDTLITAIDIISPTENLQASNVKIPPGLLKIGRNILDIQVRLLPNFTCDLGRLQDNFVTILDESVLNIPPGQIQLIRPLSVDLGFYPDILFSTSDLRDITFILPQNSPSSWKVAAQVAMTLGKAANPGLSTFNVVYGEEATQELLDDQNMIIVGRASTLPFVSEINDILPAPFDFETDTASEAGLQVSYRTPPETSLGYLELVNSPYDDGKVVLIISGNTDAGVQLAGSALMLPELIPSLSGQFAVTNGIQIVTTRSRTPLGTGMSLGSVVGTLVPNAEVVVNKPIPASTQQNLERPVWLLPVFILSGILVALLLIRYLFNLNIARKANLEVEKT